MEKFSDDPIWVTNDGVKLHISEMSTWHLINSLNLLRINWGWRKRFVVPMLKELKRRDMLFDWWFYNL